MEAIRICSEPAAVVSARVSFRLNLARTSMHQPVHALEPHYYTSPEIFAREHRSLFADSWQFAGHCGQVPNTGDFFCFETAGESLFCIKGRDGEIRTFYNVCQHRAHQLVEGSGSVNLLVCPYHAWTYELTGMLRAGPNVSSVRGFDRSQICLQQVKTEVFLGFIFVNLNLDAPPMDTVFPEVRKELAAFVPNWERLYPLEFIEIPEACNWKISVENYSECYHCSLNHPTFSSGVIKPESYDIQPQGFCLRHTTECQDLDRMNYAIRLGENPHTGQYSSWFLWPHFSFQVYPGHVLNTYVWKPVSHDKTIVWRGWYSVDGLDDESVRKLALQDRETTVEEDIRLVESVQRGLRSRGYKPGPLVIDPAGGVNSEHSVACLHEWLREALGENQDAEE